MFERFKKWRYKASVTKWLQQAYNPLFVARESIATQALLLSSTLEFLVDIQKKLLLPDDKTEAQMVRERWQANKLETTLEHYRLAIDKINEVLENMPEISNDNN